MKLRVDRNDLADAVAWVTRTVNTSRATLPALSGVLLEARDGRLTCRATDLDVAAEVTLPVAAEIEGSDESSPPPAPAAPEARLTRVVIPARTSRA